MVETAISGVEVDVSRVGIDVYGPEDSSEVTGQTVVPTEVVIVMIFSADAGQSGISEEQA